MLQSKLKQALISFKNLRVTLPYPSQPAPPPEGFRGQVAVDIGKCIGCGACAMVCPPRLINIDDLDGRRTLEFRLGRCTYCAMCADVCPVEAITLGQEFELATDDRGDLDIDVELLMAKCEHCGEAFTTRRIIDKLAAEVSKKLGMEPADMKWLHLCLNCRGAAELDKTSVAGG
ncbi:MAG TPA: 4Fe-4S dicluster domain-containing protein [Acidobacteriota bacterium]|nr:4Fe-4S dicluster domain-containing protein [Acidobacteriota bacterium]